MDLKQVGALIIATATTGLFVFSIALAMFYPSLWTFYQEIIKSYTYPAFTFGAGLLSGMHVNAVSKWMRARRRVTHG